MLPQIQCPQCRTVLPAGTPRCPACGLMFGQPLAQSKQHDYRPWIIIAAVIVISPCLFVGAMCGLGALSAASRPSSAAVLAKVRVGMTEGDVRTALGSPDRSRSDGPGTTTKMHEVWDYDTKDGTVEVEMNWGTVMDVSKL